MKVLLTHNFYQSSSPSGENAVHRNEAELLRNRGIEVILYEKHNDEISGTLNKIKTPFNAVWSRKTYHEILALIKKEKPDIAHFHNIWYLISPSAYFACKDAGVPVVQTLHNFRMFCANGLLLRNKWACEECIGKLPWRSVMHGCYRGSRLYSLPVAITEAFHRLKGTWTDQVDAYIALTDFGREKFIECGLPKEKIFVKPNFLPDPPPPSENMQDYAVFIGRLSEEKGIVPLLKALRHLKHDMLRRLRLKMIGEGPLRQKLEEEVKAHKLARTVEFLGKRSHAECMQLLREARFLILPAICYENFPMTIVEAFACGRPVVATRLGAMAEIVEHGKTGLLFESGNSEDLAAKISWMIDNPDTCADMGRNARVEFVLKYASERNFGILMKIYGSVIRT